jgi:outer membrane protein assembly factor BamB
MAAFLVSMVAQAADWPMSRLNAARNANTSEQLAAKLQLSWTLELPKPITAWPDQPRMQFDAVYQPIVVDGRMIVSSPNDDSITAYDLATGKEQWRFITGGPVRLPPVAEVVPASLPAGTEAGATRRVFAGSDDGYLYALDAAKGSLLWKFKGAPKERLVLGNGRLIDTWPVRGAPVVENGKVYFAAGIWPMMGIFVHCLDAETGKPVWSNSGEGSDFLTHPHGSKAFGGIAPQGSLVLTGDRLLVPNGRAVAACFDKNTGKMLYFTFANKYGSHDVLGGEESYFCGGMVFDLKDGKPQGTSTHWPVIAGSLLLGLGNDELQAFDLSARVKLPKPLEFKTIAKPGYLQQAATPLKGAKTLIKAGDSLYVGAQGMIAIVKLPIKPGATPWTELKVSGNVEYLAAAGGRLLASTEDGRIFCFAADGEKGDGGTGGRGDGAKGRGDAETRGRGEKAISGSAQEAGTAAGGEEAATKEQTANSAEQVKAILRETQASGGYGLVLSARETSLAEELAAQGKMHVIVVLPDEVKAAAARKGLLARGLNGHAIAVIAGDVRALPLPPYFASLVVSQLPASEEKSLAAIYRSLNPYRGMAFFAEQKEQTALEAFAKAQGKRASFDQSAIRNPQSAMFRLNRINGLEGAANWTHESADAGNTRVSKDTVVKAPLGVLWYGGSTHDGILPRHGHGPQPQVIDGRLFIEGMDKFRAMDIYSGQILWETSLPGVGSYYNNTAHHPGANGTGTNFVSTSESIYVTLDQSCLRLDPVTGKKLGEFALPADAPKGTIWGYLNVLDKYLIGGVALPTPAKDIAPIKAKKKPDEEDEDEQGEIDSGQVTPRALASQKLFVMDRMTGKVLWSVTSQTSFRHNAVCAGGGKLFAIDRVSRYKVVQPPKTTTKDKDKTTDKDKATDDKTTTTKKLPEVEFGPQDTTLPLVDGALHAFDLVTGKELWNCEKKVFGTWLSYSEEYDVLIECGRISRDNLKDESKGMRAFRGKDGEILWSNPKAPGPALIRGNTVLREKNGSDLLTGKPVMYTSPITGMKTEWLWSRLYGCNTPAAAQNLITFRSGAAGFYDLAHMGGTGNFGGFRSSCTHNLLVAGGVLCAPDYTRTCRCSYQIQTSVCLLPDPDVETWTWMGTSASVKDPIVHAAINFGAPGNRVDDSGTLWLEYPNLGGPAPKFDIKVEPEIRVPSDKAAELEDVTKQKTPKAELFRQHASVISGPLPWVTASGVRKLRTFKLKMNSEAPRAFTVKLYFAQPAGLAEQSDTSVFDVLLQGQTVAEKLDVAAAAGGVRRSLVKEFKDVMIGEEFRLELKAAAGSTTLLCGVELIEQ